MRTTIYRSGDRWLEKSGWRHGAPLTVDERTAGHRSLPLLRFAKAMIRRSQDEADRWAESKGLFAAEGTTKEYAHKCVAKMTHIQGASVGDKLLPQVAQAKAMPKSQEPQHMPQWEHDQRVNQLKQQVIKIEKEPEYDF